MNFIGGNKILLPKSMVSKIKNVNEYLNTGKAVTLGVRPEDIHEDDLFISNSPDTIVKAKIDVIEKLGAETQIYCDLDFESDKNSVVDNAAQMIAKISSRAVVNLGEVVELAFDAKHIHLFDGYTEATMLERDEHYDVIPENAEGAAFVPPTPQEMKAQIDAARVVTKEMKKQAKRDEKMAKKKALAEGAANGSSEEPPVAIAEAPAEAPTEVPAETPAPVEEKPAEIPAPAVEEKPAEVPAETPAPVEEKPAETTAPVEEKPAEKKTAPKPAAKKPAASKPAAAKSAASKPAAKPAEKKPAAAKPAAKPAAKKPTNTKKN